MSWEVFFIICDLLCFSEFRSIIKDLRFIMIFLIILLDWFFSLEKVV